jgi:hypothetical protein
LVLVEAAGSSRQFNMQEHPGGQFCFRNDHLHWRWLLVVGDVNPVGTLTGGTGVVLVVGAVNLLRVLRGQQQWCLGLLIKATTAGGVSGSRPAKQPMLAVAAAVLGTAGGNATTAQYRW